MTIIFNPMHTRVSDFSNQMKGLDFIHILASVVGHIQLNLCAHGNICLGLAVSSRMGIAGSFSIVSTLQSSCLAKEKGKQKAGSEADRRLFRWAIAVKSYQH